MTINAFLRLVRDNNLVLSSDEIRTYSALIKEGCSLYLRGSTIVVCSAHSKPKRPSSLSMSQLYNHCVFGVCNAKASQERKKPTPEYYAEYEKLFPKHGEPEFTGPSYYHWVSSYLRANHLFTSKELREYAHKRFPKEYKRYDLADADDSLPRSKRLCFIPPGQRDGF